MESVLQDLRYAIRTIFNNRGLTALIMATLALSIGANTAIFSVVNGILLRPLPYKNPGELVKVFDSWQDKQVPTSDRSEVAPANFIDWREQAQSFTEIAAFSATPVGLAAGGEPEQIVAAVVTAGFFPVLAVEPILGRTFTVEDNQTGHESVVVLSYGLWQRRFGSNPNIIGQAVMLDDESHTVVGVLPAGFQYPEKTDVWAPIVFNATPTITRDAHFLEVIARLKPGVTLQQARAEMETIARRLEQQYPATNTALSVNTVLLQDQLVEKVRPSLLILLVAVAIVLLIACVNVANLLLVRATSRQKEIAIRIAVGASWPRLIRQLLTEALLIALLGGALGLLLAMWGTQAIVSLSPTDLPRADEVSIDARVLGFNLVISLISGLIFGLAPALRAAKPDLTESLKEGHRASSGAGLKRARGMLVIAQIALALILMIAAGLMIKSFLNLQRTDSGFVAEDVLTMEISLPDARYKESRQVVSFYENLFERIESLPGVRSVGGTSLLPLGGENREFSFRIEGHTPLSPSERPISNFRVATANYFAAIGIGLVKGRSFTERDTEATPQVLIINESMARGFWPDEDPIGKRVFVRNEQFPREIVGIVRDVKHFGLDTGARPEMYVPHLQWPSRSMTLVVRVYANPANSVTAIRDQVWEVDKDQPVANIRTMDQVVSTSIGQRRFNMLVLNAFAAFALILAAMGIYGVISYSVAQRTHEIGIRMSLGAQQYDILKLVVGEGMGLTVIGVAIGLAGAFAVTRAISSFLFGVSATDPVTFAAIALLLSGTGALASYIPARRATKVDPIVALRYE